MQQTVMTSDPPRETRTPRSVLVVDDIAFERTEHIMKPGDRLFIVSIGGPNALIPLVPCWIKRVLNAC